MSSQHTFCTVFNCIDGRCQEPALAWCKKEFGATYADTVTIAGCDGVLLNDEGERERALINARISAEKHGAKRALIAGHSACAGYPTEREQHLEAIQQSAKIVSGFGLYDEVVGVFIDVADGSVTEVCRG